MAINEDERLLESPIFAIFAGIGGMCEALSVMDLRLRIWGSWVRILSDAPVYSMSYVISGRA
jgi:hypothetical protein